MSFLMTFVVAVKALRRNAMRTALTALGMIIGVAAVIVMVAIGTGARVSIENQIKSAGSNIVMVNAMDPFGGGRLLPLGNLREPLSALARAHMVILTHVDLVPEEKIASIKKEIAAINPKIPVLESVHKTDFLYDIKNEKKHALTHLENQKVTVFSGIADPSAFEDQLAQIGASIAQKWRYPDHHPFTAKELKTIEKLRDGRTLVTTFKDFPRLPAGWQDILKGEVYVLGIKLEIIHGKNIWVDTLCAGL